MYQVVVILDENRYGAHVGPLSFPSAEERLAYVKGPRVYWYYMVEDDDWRRGGAWKATAEDGPADRVNTPPEITEDDRW